MLQTTNENLEKKITYRITTESYTPVISGVTGPQGHFPILAWQGVVVAWKNRRAGNYKVNYLSQMLQQNEPK